MSVVGMDMPRRDAYDKVTGRARFAADEAYPDMAHAVLVTSTVTRGTIIGIDPTETEAVPGFRTVLTHRGEASGLRGLFMGAGGRFQSSANPLASPHVQHSGQIVALVVAETLEAAEDAASRLAIDYSSAPAAAS
ncbi:hypothetical protein [Saccharopolyspora phatthalungensis]|uniref:CO/xanthine dehydrogenase Mo-binding subunit n=1 Tax=Saccharopolyspora phatthalungensis TaxID=664693 RepID=A0A840QHT4_9PSEU|nr:hypothetical protein [Saccharopolyspora phatthalungensis]MBB5159590.1 CO/xanthine dehydrogenase Mo-binding subunit [Saccharopolyspora phatthalungensis]